MRKFVRWVCASLCKVKELNRKQMQMSKIIFLAQNSKKEFYNFHTNNIEETRKILFVISGKKERKKATK